MKYQIQIKVRGNWENTVYLPMAKEVATKIMKGLKYDYPGNYYQLIGGWKLLTSKLLH